MDNNYYIQQKFFEHFIRKYYNYAVEAKSLYTEKLMNYSTLDDFHRNAFNDAHNVILKYVSLTINDLSRLGMNNISEKYFFDKYFDKDEFYILKNDLDNIKSTYQDLLSYEREVNETINNFNRNKFKSSIRIYPKNIASIPSSIALNIGASLISGATRTISNKKQIDSLKNDVLSKKNYVFKNIQQSNSLTFSLFDSVFNMLNAFFDCIEDYLGYKVNRKFLSDATTILNSPDDKASIQLCAKKFKIDALNRYEYIDSIIKSEKNHMFFSTKISFSSEYDFIKLLIIIIVFILFLAMLNS